MGRAPCCDKANVKRGPWSPEEDTKLKEFIEKHGTGGNWIALPQKAGLKRCGKSCRLRWLNYLRPNIKHGEFSDEEDRIICSLYANIGSRWSIIAGQLPGRTDNDIKNYWNTKLKKKLMMGLTLPSPSPSPHHEIRKSPLEQPSSQNIPFPSQSVYSYRDYYNNSNYLNNSPTISFTGLESVPPFIPSPTLTTTTTTTSTSISLPLYQNQETWTGFCSPSSLQLMFGSEGSSSCCSSSEYGSCREIKKEEMTSLHDQEYYMSSSGNYHQEYSNNKFMLAIGGGHESHDGSINNINGGGEYYVNNNNNQWAEKPINGCLLQTTQTPSDYDLEMIKHLISTSNSGYFNIIDH